MKKVFITGGSRGIGRACALAFAKRGYQVGFCYFSSESDAKSLQNEINLLSQAQPFRYDLSDIKGMKNLAEQIHNEMGNIDVLINNAGISSYGLIQDVEESEFDRLMNINFKSMFFLTQALIPSMIAEKSGNIINISSIWGQAGASCEVLYSASKGAVISFTKALAKELAPSGIRVNCICPGVVDTDMMKCFSAEEREEIACEIPLGRFSEPEEIAKTALFLASADSAFITGQIIGVNGGQFC